MIQFRSKCRTWNQKINKIWADSGQDMTTCRPKRSKKEQLADFFQSHKWELLFVFIMGCLLFYLSWILPFNEAPDEEMRYMIPTYIYKHGTLPAGWDPEIRNKIWGISYGFHPILPYIFGGYLMKLVGLFNSSDKALLMSARFINILLGMAFYWYVLQIAKKLFSNKLFRAFFVALLALLPQLLYLFTYVNTDAIAVFSSAIIIFYWLEGLEHRWDRRTCSGLAVGVSICALSYFNAYGYALFSVILFVGSLIVFYGRKGVKYCTALILKRGIYITVIVFLLTGWWFIRCGILYDGDFLGLYTPDIYGEMYAMEEFKPSVKQSLAEQGVPLAQMLGTGEDDMRWVETTYRSTIGYFSYFRYALGLDIYEIHKKIFKLGILGILLHGVLFALYYGGVGIRLLMKRFGRDFALMDRFKKPEPCVSGRKMEWANFGILQFSLGCCIIIPVLLSLYYSYMNDFQPQGRYIMPLIIPVMYFTAVGIQRVMTLFFRKWVVVIMMIPLFYGVLHVFLGAFVSVYIPAFVEELAAWSEIRFPWFSNMEILTTLFHLLIPG